MAQRLTGRTLINGWLGLVIFIVINPVLYGYMQSGLNSAFDVAQIPTQMFVERAAPEVGETQAMMMHNRAVNTSAAMRDVVIPSPAR